jgi:CRP-like cAMP-binding protein
MGGNRTKGLEMSTITMHRIEGLELFEGCGRSQLKMVDQLGAAVTVAAGRVLCTEGKRGSQFFLLLHGLVQVQNSCGRLALLHPGAWFGETALIYKSRQLASVTTVLESMVIVFDRREFDELRQVTPQIRERLDATAALFARGDAPTSHPWYQGIDEQTRADRVPVTADHTRASR